MPRPYRLQTRALTMKEMASRCGIPYATFFYHVKRRAYCPQPSILIGQRWHYAHEDVEAIKSYWASLRMSTPE